MDYNISRIAIIGPPGAGKSTLLNELGKHTGFKTIELDMLAWDKGWVRVKSDVLVNRLESQLSEARWITDGLYSELIVNLNTKADLIVFVNAPLWICLWRVLKRSFKRVLFKHEVCNGNRESLITLFKPNGMLSYTISNRHWYRKQLHKFSSNKLYLYKNMDSLLFKMQTGK